jgi:hypothetical protein
MNVRTTEMFQSMKTLSFLLNEKGNCLTYELENYQEFQKSITKKMFLQISKRNFFIFQLIFLIHPLFYYYIRAIFHWYCKSECNENCSH